MSLHFRHIAMLLHRDISVTAAVTALSGVEVYTVANQDDIDMALLSNLETPCKLIFVGRDAKPVAELYGGTWIEDGPDVENTLLRLWGLAGTAKM
jgi:hypothetical protein